MKAYSWYDVIEHSQVRNTPTASRAINERKDDPTDIASDEEAMQNECQCLIHSKFREKVKGVSQLDYKFNGKF